MIQTELHEWRNFEQSSLTGIVECHPEINENPFDSILMVQSYPIDKPLK